MTDQNPTHISYRRSGGELAKTRDQAVTDYFLTLDKTIRGNSRPPFHHNITDFPVRWNQLSASCDNSYSHIHLLSVALRQLKKYADREHVADCIRFLHGADSFSHALTPLLRPSHFPRLPDGFVNAGHVIRSALELDIPPDATLQSFTQQWVKNIRTGITMIDSDTNLVWNIKALATISESPLEFGQDGFLAVQSCMNELGQSDPLPGTDLLRCFRAIADLWKNETLRADAPTANALRSYVVSCTAHVDAQIKADKITDPEAVVAYFTTFVTVAKHEFAEYCQNNKGSPLLRLFDTHLARDPVRVQNNNKLAAQMRQALGVEIGKIQQG